MASVIRLKMLGRKKKAFYRVVVTEKASKRDGKVTATLGYFDPNTKPPTIKVDDKKLQEWLKHGAQPSEAIRKLLSL